MKEKITKLISVKSIITLVCLGLFVWTTTQGVTDGDFFKTIFTMIVSFYFGTQVQKKADGE